MVDPLEDQVRPDSGLLCQGLPAGRRGEVWKTVLDPTVGHEQGETRPCLIVSDDDMNTGPSGLVILVPITSKFRGISTWVEFKPGEAGLTTPSWAIPEAVRSVSRCRLLKFMGTATETKLQEIVRCLRYLIPV